MNTNSENKTPPTNINNELVSGPVKVLKTPISERYCNVGDEALLDIENKKIRCSGAWFDFDERWLVEPCH